VVFHIDTSYTKEYNGGIHVYTSFMGQLLEQTLTVQQVADILGFDHRTIRRWIRLKRILTPGSVIYLGHSVRILRREIERIQREGTEKPTITRDINNR